MEDIQFRFDRVGRDQWLGCALLLVDNIGNDPKERTLTLSGLIRVLHYLNLIDTTIPLTKCLLPEDGTDIGKMYIDQADMKQYLLFYLMMGDFILDDIVPKIRTIVEKWLLYLPPIEKNTTEAEYQIINKVLNIPRKIKSS